MFISKRESNGIDPSPGKHHYDLFPLKAIELKWNSFARLVSRRWAIESCPNHCPMMQQWMTARILLHPTEVFQLLEIPFLWGKPKKPLWGNSDLCQLNHWHKPMLPYAGGAWPGWGSVFSGHHQYWLHPILGLIHPPPPCPINTLFHLPVHHSTHFFPNTRVGLPAPAATLGSANKGESTAPSLSV